MAWRAAPGHAWRLWILHCSIASIALQTLWGFQHCLKPSCHSPEEIFLPCSCSLFPTQLGASIHLQLKKTKLSLHSLPHSRRTAVFLSCSFSHVICCVCAAGPLLLLTFQPSLKVALLPDALSADSPSINLIEKTASPLTVLMSAVQSESR